LYDESHLAKLVSERFGLNFNSIKLDGNELFDNLIKATWYHDDPLIHQNDAQMLALSIHAKSKVTVLLSGEGGDELMGGYVRYKPLNYYPLLKIAGTIGGIFKFMNSKSIVNRFDKLNRYTKGSNLKEMVMLNSLNVYPNDFNMMGFNYLEKFSEYRNYVQEEAENIFPDEPARQAMYSDMFIHMSSVLDRNDRMTMGAGIECRVPFMDYRLLEMIPALPSRYLLKGKKGKFLLANSVAKKLPNEVINFKKLGFSVPWEDYFKKNPAFKEMFNNIENGSLSEFIGEYNFKKNFQNDIEFKNLLKRQLLMLEFWRVFYYNSL
jgi:asparagine synthase (glutamine-hydrolysing)